MTGDQASLADQARTDAARYAANLARPDGWETCASIEQDWALYGYPPEVVSTVLAAVADGEDFATAESRALQAAATSETARDASAKGGSGMSNPQNPEKFQ